MDLGRAIALAVSLLGVSGPAAAQILAPSFDEVPLADLLEILVLERERVAVDAANGGQTTLALHLEEQVVWSGARGKVGVVLTDRRVLIFRAPSGAWSERKLDLSS